MKPLTSLFLANLLIEEIESTGKLVFSFSSGEYKRGTLKSPPDSKKESDDIIEKLENKNKKPEQPLVFPIKDRIFQVPPEVRRAIIENKEYFRGGAAGSGLVPDTIFSRSIVHPTDSGMWVEYLYEKMRALPPGKERDNVYAFVMGLTVNYAAGMFVDAYVSEYAAGWSSGTVDTIAKRINAIEDYMDSKVSGVVKTADRNAAIPSDFLKACFSDVDGIEKKIKSIEKRKYTILIKEGTKKKEYADEKGTERSDGTLSTYKAGNMLLRHFSVILNTVRSFTVYDPEKETSVHTKVLGSDGATEKVAAWADEIEKAVKEWISVWGKIMQGVLNAEGAPCVEKLVKTWHADHWKKITAVPEGLDKEKDGIKQVIEQYEKISELSKLRALKFEEGKEISEVLFPNQYLWMKEAYKVGEFKKLSDQDVNTLFDSKFDGATGLYGSLDNDMKGFGSPEPYDEATMIKLKERLSRVVLQYPYGIAEKEFRAFSLGMSVSKLCLIGNKGLNDYLGQKDAYKAAAPAYAVRKLTLKVTARQNDYDEIEPIEYGPIRFEVRAEKTGTLRTRIECKFGNGKSIEKTLDLHRMIPYDDIKAFNISIKGMDFWNIQTAELLDADTKRSLGTMKNSLSTGEDEGFEIEPVKNPFEGDKEFEVPSAIVSWNYSLNGRDITGENPAKYRPWEYKEFVIFRAVYENKSSQSDSKSASKTASGKGSKTSSKDGSDPWAKYFDISSFMDILYSFFGVKKEKMKIPEKADEDEKMSIDNANGKNKKTNDGDGKEMDQTMKKEDKSPQEKI
ncbi:MAG: hypothetical protein FWC52_02215 [Candidatus Methanoplasma sp.]|nr:hypothetical protein [Candidatus Methanoplasma sp.]